MEYVFSATTQALLALGKLEQIRTVGGQLLPLVRNPATGHIVEMAKAVSGFSLQPLVASTQLIAAPMQMLQTHLGFQKTYRMLDTLQNSVGLLQSTTYLIGMGTVAGVVLSAVNLHQTLKLRNEVKDGFISLKLALKDQGEEIIQRIDQVAQDIKFDAHKLVLVRAYGKFQQALSLIKTALLIEDLNIRNANLANAQLLLANALADYNEPQLFESTSAAGHLRRVECAWAIEQTMALTFQLQNQPAAVSDRLSHLQDKIRQDSLTVIERCDSQEELDFLFPELIRIHNHDFAVLKSWQNQVDWIKTLSPAERQQLATAELPADDESAATEESAVIAEPAEQILYENLKQKSHYVSLRDQLKFMIKPNLRREHESYITQQAITSGYPGLAPANWQEIPDLTVANLYWYFKVKEASAGA